MLPAGPLMIEHRLIERMVAVAASHRIEIDGGGRPDRRLIDNLVDFFRTYADECHHGKEEDLLFARLQSKPLPPALAEAMGRLIEDHVRSRALVVKLDGLNQGEDGGQISEVLGQLTTLYPDHIRREDKEFFPQAMQYLDREESDQMLNEFREFDGKLIHHKYLTLVEGAEKR
jgi:hemerythrin-like domain-containing protein